MFVDDKGIKLATLKSKKPLAAYLTFSLTHERSSGVAVARIHATFFVPSADHVLGDVRVVLLAAALFVRDDRDLRMLQELGLISLPRLKDAHLLELLKDLLCIPQPAMVHLSPGCGESKRFSGRQMKLISRVGCFGVHGEIIITKKTPLIWRESAHKYL